MIFLLSIEWIFFATASTTWPHGVGLGGAGSIGSAVPPYAFRYALTNAGFAGVFASGNQSPALKMPLTFFAPDLARELGRVVRPVREEHELRAELLLHHRLHLSE